MVVSQRVSKTGPELIVPNMVVGQTVLGRVSVKPVGAARSSALTFLGVKVLWDQRSLHLIFANQGLVKISSQRVPSHFVRVRGPGRSKCRAKCNHRPGSRGQASN